MTIPKCGPSALAEVTGEDARTVADKMSERGWLTVDGATWFQAMLGYLMEAGYEMSQNGYVLEDDEIQDGWRPRTVKQFLNELSPRPKQPEMLKHILYGPDCCVLLGLREHVFVIDPLRHRWWDSDGLGWRPFPCSRWNRHRVRMAIMTWPKGRPRPDLRLPD